MDLPEVSVQRVNRYRNGTMLSEDVITASEYALTLVVNGQEFATMVCTPSSMEELTMGFLASERLIQGADDVRSLVISAQEGLAFVELTNETPIDVSRFSRRTLSSCCGKGRQSFYLQSDASTQPVAQAGPYVDGATVLSAVKELHVSSGLFKKTGGVHNAALFREAEGILAMRSDIGRHNALDKLYGWMLRDHVSAEGLGVAFSGRVSSEILLKVAKMGIGLVVSKSAATDLAVELAKTLQITVIGFARGDGFTVYSHPQRICM